MTNEGIKQKAKTTTEKVGETIKTVVGQKGTEIHKEIVPQKIYVGPNLLGLPKYTVVESINVPHIKKFIEDCPEIEKLFVAINKMAESETRISQKGTLEHRYYNKVNEFKVGKGDQ